MEYEIYTVIAILGDY